MRDAGGARLREPQRFLAPRQPQPFKVKLADQRDAPSPSQAEGALPTGPILTKASAILPQPDCNSRRGIAPDCTRLHQIAPNCTKLRSLRQKIKKGENQAGRKVFCPYLFAPILLPAKWRRRPARPCRPPPSARSRREAFEQLKEFLLVGGRGTPYAELAARLGTSEGAVKVAVHPLRQRYRELLEEEIANTGTSPEEAGEERRYLLAVLSR
jgi:hypothetical protein